MNNWATDEGLQHKDVAESTSTRKANKCHIWLSKVLRSRWNSRRFLVVHLVAFWSYLGIMMSDFDEHRRKLFQSVSRTFLNLLGPPKQFRKSNKLEPNFLITPKTNLTTIDLSAQNRIWQFAPSPWIFLIVRRISLIVMDLYILVDKPTISRCFWIVLQSA